MSPKLWRPRRLLPAALAERAMPPWADIQRVPFVCVPDSNWAPTGFPMLESLGGDLHTHHASFSQLRLWWAAFPHPGKDDQKIRLLGGALRGKEPACTHPGKFVRVVVQTRPCTVFSLRYVVVCGHRSAVNNLSTTNAYVAGWTRLIHPVVQKLAQHFRDRRVFPFGLLLCAPPQVFLHPNIAEGGSCWSHPRRRWSSIRHDVTSFSFANGRCTSATPLLLLPTCQWVQNSH